MQTLQTRQMTVDEFLPWAGAQESGRYELHDGRVVLLPPGNGDTGRPKGQRMQRCTVHAYPPLSGSREGIDRFLVACTCVGIRRAANEPQGVYATYGLGDLYAGVLRNNPANPKTELFEKKAASYIERWPWLRVEGLRGR